MTTLFYREWRVFALAVGMIVVTGLTAISTIGRQEDPTITNLFATVLTPYPGASPARVESLVTEKIEEELKEIEEIEEITSTSREGISVVGVELSKFLTDSEIETAWSEIRDALSDAAVQFPPGVPEPEFDNDRTGAFTVVSALVPAEGAPYNPAILRRYGEQLQDRMRQLPGADQVRDFGFREEEVGVIIDPRRLSQLGLMPEQVSAAILAADAKVRAGQLRGGDTNLLIEVAGEIETVGRVAEIPVGTGPDGAIVRVGDVASIERGVREPAESLAFTNGVPAVLIGTEMSEGRQVDSWMTMVREELADFERILPSGIEHRLLFDQSEYTIDRLSTLISNLLIGSGLVILVLFFTLGWRGAVIVACILPLTTLFSLTVLQYLGLPIHQMSVAGLIVALGLLVDAAIVMTDDIRRRLLHGEPRLKSVEHGVRRLAAPLLASTVTTILAFVPMAVLPGPAGDFVGSIALAVIVMLTASFLLALTVTPALAGWMLPGTEAHESDIWLNRGVRAGRLGDLFAKSLDWALTHRKTALFAAVALPLTGFLSFGSLTAQFFPGIDRDQFYVQVRLDGTASIERTRAAAMKAGDIIAGDPNVTAVHWVIGESAPSFYYNMQMNQDGVSAFAEALVTTDDKWITRDVIPRLQARLDAALPGAQVLVRGLVQGPPVDAPVEVRVSGPNLEQLRVIGDELRARMANTAFITHTKADLSGGDPKVVFDLDEDKVRQAGLSLTDVAAFLEASLEGATGGSLIEATEELPVRVRVGSDWRGALDAIRALDMPVPAGTTTIGGGVRSAYRSIPLAGLGTLRMEPSESPISRRDGERENNIQGYIPYDVLPEEALTVFQENLTAAPIALPAGYRISYGGDSDARSETVGNLVASLGLIAVLTVATIVLTFNSFSLSLITGIVAILSMGMSLLALEVFNYPFGIQALIGVIGSIGVSINAAIIIMTGLQKNAGAMAGDPASVRDVVVESSRHIVSTTTTTFGGFLPLIIEGGGFWPPFAMSIAGGVLLSTIVSFYFTPPAFLAMLGRKKASLAMVSGGMAGGHGSRDIIRPAAAE